ncbi:Uncharacterised protein [Enterobacter cloacae]|nr:Uncharacterised protein [Enterobacter cloacae]
MTIGRGISDVFRKNIGIGEFNLLREGVVGFKHIKQHQRRYAACGIARREIQKFAFADFTVGVIVIVIKQLLRKIFGSQARHRLSP